MTNLFHYDRGNITLSYVYCASCINEIEIESRGVRENPRERSMHCAASAGWQSILNINV